LLQEKKKWLFIFCANKKRSKKVALNICVYPQQPYKTGAKVFCLFPVLYIYFGTAITGASWVVYAVIPVQAGIHHKISML
jgi:hypothetical protein